MATMTTDEMKVCVFCDCEAQMMSVGTREMAFCPVCRDYKGIMTVSAYEAYTGNSWYGDDDSEDEA